MKNKLLAAAVISLMIGQTILAQNLDLPTAYLQNNTSGKNNIPANVVGSPYFEEKFIFGTVFIKDSESYNAKMRYNAYNDEIEMKEQGKTISLMKRDYIKAEMNGTMIAIHGYMSKNLLKKGYFMELNKGEAKLLLKKSMELSEGKKATSSYSKDSPPKFSAKEEYYISKNDNPANQIKLKAKDIINTLSDKKSELEAYVKENKLKIKTSEDAVLLVNYYNSL